MIVNEHHNPMQLAKFSAMVRIANTFSPDIVPSADVGSLNVAKLPKVFVILEPCSFLSIIILCN